MGGERELSGNDRGMPHVPVVEVPDYAILALDADGLIQTWNLGAHLLKGYTAEEAIGQHFSMFYPSEDREAGLPEQLLDRAREAGSVKHTGWRVRKDGERFWGDVSITAIHDDDGRPTGFVKVVRDVTERHAAQQALRESEERFRLLVSQVVDYAIISLDTDGVIQTWNAGAELLKGYTAEEAIGQHFSMFYPSEDHEAGLPEQLLDRAREEGAVTHTGWRLRKDGERFWADVVMTAVHDEEGRLTGFGKVTRDRTDAKRVDELRNALYSGLTHDLRTPISAIGGFASLLRSTEDENERKELIDRLLDNTRTLSGLVDQLLEYVRLQTGKVDLALDAIDLTGVIQDTVAKLGPVLGDRTVVLPRRRHEANADRGSVERILSNLLVNAARYSEDGTTITVGVEAGDEGVEVTVCDEGRGIEEEDLHRIFEEFERGRLSDDRRGVGLGLAIVQHLVDLHDGAVWIDSAVGDGTTVGFQLPAVDTANEPVDGDTWFRGG